MVANRVHPLISPSEDEVPSAKYAYPSVTDKSLSNSRGGWKGLPLSGKNADLDLTLTVNFTWATCDLLVATM